MHRLFCWRFAFCRSSSNVMIGGPLGASLLADLLVADFVSSFRELFPSLVVFACSKGTCSLCSLICTCLYILTCWFPALFRF
jgi:hypothetical protein